MNLNFSPVTLASLPVLRAFLPSGGTGDCYLSPAALVSLAEAQQTSIAVEDDVLFIKWRPRPVMPEVFCWPIGRAADARLIEEFGDYLLSSGREVLLYGDIERITGELGAILPYRNFSLHSTNAWWDYLYSRQTIAELSGRPLHRKRNFVRRFYAAHPNASIRPLAAASQAECLSFLDKWLAGREPSASLTAEKQAIEFAFAHFDELGLQGAILSEGDTIYGFTFGALCAPGVFAIHIEKADKECVGAYPALTSGFAALLPESVTTLNREEDIGISGLRKAKQDWNPQRMLQKGYVRLMPGEY